MNELHCKREIGELDLRLLTCEKIASKFTTSNLIWKIVPTDFVVRSLVDGMTHELDWLELRRFAERITET